MTSAREVLGGLTFSKGPSGRFAQSIGITATAAATGTGQAPPVVTCARQVLRNSPLPQREPTPPRARTPRLPRPGRRRPRPRHPRRPGRRRPDRAPGRASRPPGRFRGRGGCRRPARRRLPLPTPPRAPPRSPRPRSLRRPAPRGTPPTAPQRRTPRPACRWGGLLEPPAERRGLLVACLPERGACGCHGSCLGLPLGSRNAVGDLSLCPLGRGSGARGTEMGGVPVGVAVRVERLEHDGGPQFVAATLLTGRDVVGRPLDAVDRRATAVAMGSGCLSFSAAGASVRACTGAGVSASSWACTAASASASATSPAVGPALGMGVSVTPVQRRWANRGSVTSSCTPAACRSHSRYRWVGRSANATVSCLLAGDPQPPRRLVWA